MKRHTSEVWLVVISLLLLCAVAIWLMSGFGNGAPSYPPMSTYSPRPEGAKALYALCQYAGLDARQYHDTEYDYPPGAGCVVLDKPDTTTPMFMGGALDARALRLWLEDGGRLLLVSEALRSLGPELFAEIDRGEGLTPYGGSVLEWEYPDSTTSRQQPVVSGAQDGESAAEELGIFVTDAPNIADWSDNSQRSGQAAALWRMYRPGHIFELSPERAEFWKDVRLIETAAAGMVPFVRGDVLLATEDATQPVVIYRRVGRGELLWLTRPEIASNDWIDRVDNHRLLLALLTHTAGGGPLYFDEHIHGYARQSPSLVGLLLDTTGGRLLLALAVAIIMLFLGAAVRPARFHAQPVPPRRQAAEMVLAQADLYRRAGSSRATARHLLNGLQRALAKARGSSVGAAQLSLPGALAAARQNPAVSARDVDYLLDFSSGGRPVNNAELRHLARACDALRRALHVQSG